MKSIDLAEASLLQPFVACLERRGLNAERFLERRRIPPGLVASGNGKILRRQAWDFFGDVVRNEGIETIGFLDNDPFPIEALGPVGLAMQKAVTLRDAIETLAALMPHVAMENTVWLEEGREHAWLCCRGEDVVPEVFPTDHLTLVGLTEVVRLAAGPDWRPSGIRLQTGPSGALEKAALVSGVEPHFFQRGSGVRFSSALLSARVRTRQSNGNQNGTAARPSSPQTHGDALQILLESLLPHGIIPTSDEVAEILGVHRSTLFRSLVEEGVTWRRLVERVRFNAAREMLCDHGISVKAIAFELGYSDPSNFMRAFRRMTGISPQAYRRRD